METFIILMFIPALIFLFMLMKKDEKEEAAIKTKEEEEARRKGVALYERLQRMYNIDIKKEMELLSMYEGDAHHKEIESLIGAPYVYSIKAPQKEETMGKLCHKFGFNYVDPALFEDNKLLREAAGIEGG